MWQETATTWACVCLGFLLFLYNTDDVLDATACVATRIYWSALWLRRTCAGCRLVRNQTREPTREQTKAREEATSRPRSYAAEDERIAALLVPPAWREALPPAPPESDSD